GGREIRIRKLAFLWPLETRERFEIGRRTGAGREPIGIGTVGIDIHVGLQEDRAPMALGVAQLQDRLAIVKVVAGEKLIEPEEVLAQISELRVVEFLKIRRDRFRR